MYKNVKGGGRVAWLDNVKMYAMLWVILGHVMTIVIKTNVDLSGRVMEHFIVAFNMPLFVMLSGYSNFNAFNRIVDKQGLWNFIKKSTIRILLPVVTFCVIGMTPNFLLSPFWFLNMILYLMLGFSVIHFVVYALHKQHLFGVSLLIFVLAFIGLNVLWIGEMCTYYAVGLLCKRYGVFDRPRRFLFPVILFVGIALFAIVWSSGHYSIKESSFYHSGFSQLLSKGYLFLWAECQILAIVLCFGMIGIFCNYDTRYTLFSWMGSYTLSFYIFHAMMLRPFRNDIILDYFYNSVFYQFFYSTEILRWCGVLIVVALMTAASWGLICLCEKWKWSRLFCLGKLK